MTPSAPADRSRQGPDRDPRARQPHRPGCEQAGPTRHDVVERGTAQGAAHAGEAEPLVGHHHDGTGTPQGVHDRGEVGRGLDEEPDPVTGSDAGRGHPRGELADPRRHPLPAHHAAGDRHHGSGVLRAALERGPQRLAADVGGRRGRGRGPGRGRQVAQPGGHGIRVLRRVLGDQVRGPLETVQPGLREPVLEVGEVPLTEDGVARAPEHQGGNVEPPHPLGQLGDGVVRGVARGERDVGDEVTDGLSPVRAAVGQRERIAHVAWQGGPRQGRGPADEEGCRDAAERADAGQVREADQRGSEVAGGLGHGGVAEDDAEQLLAVRQRPAERDDAAPVVPHGDDGAVDPEGGGQGAEVVDPLADAACLRRSLGEAHSEVVGCDHAPPGRGRGQQAAPQVGPGGVAVDAQHRAVHRLGAVVEEVPGARDPVAVGDGHRARPRRVEPGQAGQVRRARRARCSR